MVHTSMLVRPSLCRNEQWYTTMYVQTQVEVLGSVRATH
ncbi:hypothetical protein A2U01_0017576, partial [Trifolium medium]|nr:hypothetical protein [Trifolium medium]